MRDVEDCSVRVRDALTSAVSSWENEIVDERIAETVFENEPDFVPLSSTEMELVRVRNEEGVRL